MIQTEHVAGLLKKTYPELKVTLVELSTKGDEILDRPLADIGGKALFVKNLERALQDGEADIAVHSLKDVPSVLPGMFKLCAYLPRENPFDAFISSGYDFVAQLPKGATVGTASPRRSAELLRARPDLNIVLLRGNVPTRLQKIQDGEMQAAVLAVAGLRRLKMAGCIRSIFEPEAMLPAPGQGIVAIECLRSRQDLIELVGVLNDAQTAACARAERGVSAGLGGDCHSPICAYAEIEGDKLNLKGRVLSPDGKVCLDASMYGNVSNAKAIGAAVAQRLLSQGADKYL